jgi:hypothetical protein
MVLTLSRQFVTLTGTGKAVRVFLFQKFIPLLEIFRFFEYHAQNLNTPQKNSASWDLQLGFNSAFKGLIAVVEKQH